MPRVHTRTKSTRGRPTFPCRACSEPIKPGEKFYTWKKRYGGTSYMHVSHGFPKPSMLSNRKTAVIEDATGDFPSTVESTDEISEALNAIAEIARDVGGEYEASADNMPESLQQGYQAEAMREVAQELETWADDLESWEPEQDEPDENDYQETDQDAFDQARKAWEDSEPPDDGSQRRQDWEADEPEEDEFQITDTEAHSDAVAEWLDQELSNAQDKLGEMPEYQG